MINTLHAFMRLADKLIPKKPALPVLNYAFIHDGLIRMSDLETYIAMPIADKRTYTLPLSVIRKLIALKPDTITINLLDDNTLQVLVKSQQITVDYVSGEDYPQEPGGTFTAVAEWNHDLLLRFAAQSRFASDDTLRPALTGIFISQNDHLHSVATDGHILQWYVHEADSFKTIEAFTAVVPRLPLRYLARQLYGPVRVLLNNNYLRLVTHNQARITIRLIAEEFVDYERVFPQECTHRMLLSRTDLMTALNETRSFIAREERIAVTISGPYMHLSARTEDLSVKGCVQLQEDYGNDFQVQFNSNLLTTVLKNMDGDTLEWSCAKPQGPHVLKSQNDVRQLIMPIREEADDDH